MRVLMVSDVYFPRINGVSTSIQTFRRDLAPAGVESVLVCPDYPGAQPAPDIVRVPSRYLFFDPEDRMMRGGPLRRLVGARTAAERFDLVHVHTPFVAHYAGVHWARRLGVPVVETYHTYFEEYLHHYVPWVPNRLLAGLSRRFSRTQCNAVDAVVVPSLAIEALLRRYGVSTPLHRIPTGIDLDQFEGGDGERFRRQHGIPVDRPMLLHVGRAAKEKNIDSLVRMMQRVVARRPDALLVIAGEGPALPGLRALAAKLGLGESVRFVGYLDRRTTLIDCYRAADAFVFGSRTETQGLVLLEAMAVGLPLVSIAAMGALDILVPDCGALVVEENEAEFADAVVRLLDDEALRQRLAARARATAESWASPRMAETLADLYARLIAGDPESAAERRTPTGRASATATE